MFKSIITLFSGSIVSQLIPFLFLPLISNLYSPENFGFFSTIMAIVSILLVISMLRYEQAIIQMDFFEEKEAALICCLMFLLITTVVVMVVILLFFQIEKYFIVPCILFFYSGNILIDKLMNSLKLYKMMSTQRIIKSIIEVFFTVFIGYFFQNELGLAYGLIAGLMVSTYYMCHKLPINIKFPSKLKVKVLRSYIDFPKYNLPHATITSLVSYLPVLIIPMYFGYEELGYYAFGLKVIQTPLTLIASSIYSVIGPMVYLDKKNKKITALKFIVRVFKWQVVTSIILSLVLLSPVFGYIFNYIFSENWSKSVEYVRYMIPVICLTFIVGPYACVINIFEQQKKALLMEVIYSIAKVVTVLLFVDQGVDAFIFSFSIVSSICLGISLLWYMNILNNNYKQKLNL